MGLDLYAGSLARYHTGAWETIMQRTAREQGMKVNIVYADGAPTRLSTQDAALMVSGWRDQLQSKYRIPNGLSWSESSSAPYWSDKPDHDGQRALVLATAYAEHPELDLPTTLPDEVEDDPAYIAASGDYFSSAIAILECHMFLPSEEIFIFLEHDAVGVKRVTTSTANLARSLDRINGFYWRASSDQLAEWLRRGPAGPGTAMEIEAGKLVHHKKVLPSGNSFQHSAQFGFAIYNEALIFSRAHNVPIMTDE